MVRTQKSCGKSTIVSPGVCNLERAVGDSALSDVKASGFASNDDVHTGCQNVSLSPTVPHSH